jgi:imidazolonepropionase-like amidohydrolase
MVMAITNARLIDGTGAAPVENATVVIDGGKISAVGAGIPAPDGAEVWDAGGLAVLPGLIDAHVHIIGNPDWKARPDRQPASDELIALRTAKYARQTLEAGFTTVRDMAAPNKPIFALRQAAAEGAIPSPRIIASGNCLTITSGHGTEYGSPMYWEVDDAESFRVAVRQQFKAGADFIKIIQTESTLFPHVPGRVYFSVEEMRPGIEDAHAVGMKVAAHANTTLEGIRNAIEAGVDTIEHGYPASDDLLEMMAKRGIILLPTLSVYYQINSAVKKDGLPLPPPVVQRLDRVCEQVMDTARRAYKLGVKIALGTDAGNPNTWHGDSALELELLAQAGLSPMEAVIAATKTAAEACGRESSLGTVQAGKIADLIAVRGDPLANLTLLRDKANIRRVYQNGQLVHEKKD